MAVRVHRAAKRRLEIAAVTTPEGGDKRPNAAQMARRNEMIVEDHLRGVSEERISKDYKITTRQIRNVLTAWGKTEKPKMAGRNPIAIVWETIDRYEAWQRQLAEIAADADADSARVGAINSQASIQDKMMDLLQKSGILPRDLGQLRIQADVLFLSKQLVEIFETHNVPRPVIDEVVRVLDASTGGQG